MRILLVSPAFHGYWRSVADALRRQDHTVTAAIYSRFDSVAARTRNKLLAELPDRLGSQMGRQYAMRRATSGVLERLRSIRADAVIVIKGDLLLDCFWDELESRRVPSILWLYDDLHHGRHHEGSLLRATYLATYSHDDQQELVAQGHSCSYVPMAFDPHLALTSRPEDAVVFVGARYPERERRLAALRTAGVPVVAYGREWSQRWRDRARSWQLHRPDVTGRPDLTRSEAMAVFRGGAAAVNIHANQTGFNPRTFEVPGAGGVQLIDRPDVAGLYEPDSEVITFESDDELVEAASRALRDRSWSKRIGEAGRARSLAEHTYDHRVRALLSDL